MKRFFWLVHLADKKNRRYCTLRPKSLFHFVLHQPSRQYTAMAPNFQSLHWYNTFRHPGPGRWNIFTERNIQAHNDIRRQYQSAYSMSSLVHYESYVDECVDIFSQRLRERARDGPLYEYGALVQLLCLWCDWTHYLFKATGFSRLRGRCRWIVIDTGSGAEIRKPCGHICVDSSVYVCDEHLVGWRKGNKKKLYWKLYEWKSRGTWERSRRGKVGERCRVIGVTGLTRRFRDQVFGETRSRSKVFYYASSYCWLRIGKFSCASTRTIKRETNICTFRDQNMFAGSDTTATSLSAILYYLLRNPKTLKRLRQEINSQQRAESKAHYIQGKPGSTVSSSRDERSSQDVSGDRGSAWTSSTSWRSYDMRPVFSWGGELHTDIAIARNLTCWPFTDYCRSQTLG